MYICIYVCMYIYICIYTCISIHIHSYKLDIRCKVVPAIRDILEEIVRKGSVDMDLIHCTLMIHPLSNTQSLILDFLLHQVPCLRSYIYLYTHINAYMLMFKNTYIHTYIRKYMYSYIYYYMRIYTYIYYYMRTDTIDFFLDR